jgi:HK97 family phage prohead protease
MENKGIINENLSVKTEGLHTYLEGYAAVYGNVDSYKDIIQAGAFDSFLASEEVKRVKFCYNHDITKILGIVEELRSDERGLFFKAKISNTSLGKDVAELISDGALQECSIGYKTEESYYKDDGVRVLTKLSLYEFSIVSRAANPKAVLTGAERKDEEVKTNLKEMDYTQLKSKLEELEAQKAEILAEMDARVIMAIKLK